MYGSQELRDHSDSCPDGDAEATDLGKFDVCDKFLRYMYKIFTGCPSYFTRTTVKIMCLKNVMHATLILSKIFIFVIRSKSGGHERRW